MSTLEESFQKKFYLDALYELNDYVKVRSNLLNCILGEVSNLRCNNYRNKKGDYNCYNCIKDFCKGEINEM